MLYFLLGYLTVVAGTNRSAGYLTSINDLLLSMTIFTNIAGICVGLLAARREVDHGTAVFGIVLNAIPMPIAALFFFA